MDDEKIYNEFKQVQNQPETAGERPSLRRAIELISSLITLSHSIKVFPVKWQLIRKKLDELLSGLQAAWNCDSDENPLFSGTVEAITATIRECSYFARRCANLSYSGKLLMQSDLDIVSTKLDTHIKRQSEIYAADLLAQRFAIVVPRPGVSASREDMKFYVRDLFARLKIGSSEMKKQALGAFNELIREDEKYVKVSMEVENFVSVLVNFLDAGEIEVQEEVAMAVSVMSEVEQCKGDLVGAGIIAPLIRILECGSESGKESAARCLKKLTENSDNAWSISAQGGVSALLKICSINTHSGGELVSSSCGILQNLAGIEEIKRFMVEEGAISTFINLAKSKDEVFQMSSIDFLQSLSSADDSIREMVVREGGIRALVRILDPKSNFSLKPRETAFKAIVTLCNSSPNSLKLLLKHGFIDHIFYFIRNGELLVQEMALKAASWLCRTSEEAKKAMGEAGFMPELAKFLYSKSFEIREMAAEALSEILSVSKNRKRFGQSEQNVGMILRMLDPEEEEEEEEEQSDSRHRKLLLSILLSLSSCSSGRKTIANSGHVNKIRKLAEAEVSDAKKIVRNLSSNRIRSIFSGIMWHS